MGSFPLQTNLETQNPMGSEGVWVCEVWDRREATVYFSPLASLLTTWGVETPHLYDL